MEVDKVYESIAAAAHGGSEEDNIKQQKMAWMLTHEFQTQGTPEFVNDGRSEYGRVIDLSEETVRCAVFEGEPRSCRSLR